MGDETLSRLIAIPPGDYEEHRVDCFVTEISLVRIPKEMYINCSVCHKFEEKVDIDPFKAVKLAGRKMTAAAERDYIRKNFNFHKCHRCKKYSLYLNPTLDREAFLLRIRDVDRRVETYEFDIEEDEEAYYVPRDFEDKTNFLKICEHGSSIRLTVQQIRRQSAKFFSKRIFWVKKAELTKKIVRRGKEYSLEDARDMALLVLAQGDFAGNNKKLANSYAQWVAGRYFEKTWINIWGFSCPESPVNIMLCGDSQSAKSNMMASFMNRFDRKEGAEKDKGGVRDVYFQGENLKRTAFYYYEQDEKDEIKRWTIRRGAGLRATRGRIVIDSLHESTEEVLDITREATATHRISPAGAGTKGRVRDIPFITRMGIIFNLENAVNYWPRRAEVYRYGVSKVLKQQDLNRYPIKLLFARDDVKEDAMLEAIEQYNAGGYDGLDGRVIVDGVKEENSSFLPPEAMRSLKALCDSLTKNSFILPPDTLKSLKYIVHKRLRKYSNSPIEFYANTFYDQCESILMGMAFIAFKWKGNKLYIYPNLVEVLDNLLNTMEDKWGLHTMEDMAHEADKSVVVMRYTLGKLQQSDKLEYDVFKIVAANQLATNKILKEGLDADGAVLWNCLHKLSKKGLIEKVKRGAYRTTRSGMLAYAALIEDRKFSQQQRVDFIQEMLLKADGITRWDEMVETAEVMGIPRNTIETDLRKLIEGKRIVQYNKDELAWNGDLDE